MAFQLTFQRQKSQQMVRIANSFFVWFLLAELLVNVYPILHLRHIRGRLDRTIHRMGVAQVGGESDK